MKLNVTDNLTLEIYKLMILLHYCPRTGGGFLVSQVTVSSTFIILTISLSQLPGRGPSQPAPKFVGNLVAFLLNLVRIVLACLSSMHLCA